MRQPPDHGPQDGARAPILFVFPLLTQANHLDQTFVGILDEAVRIAMKYADGRNLGQYLEMCSAFPQHFNDRFRSTVSTCQLVDHRLLSRDQCLQFI